MSIPVNGPLTRRNSANFALVDDGDVGGGFRVVATTAARDAIPSSQLKVGMLVYVTATGLRYRCLTTAPTWVVDTGGVISWTPNKSWTEVYAEITAAIAAGNTHPIVDVPVTVPDGFLDQTYTITGASPLVASCYWRGNKYSSQVQIASGATISDQSSGRLFISNVYFYCLGGSIVPANSTWYIYLDGYAGFQVGGASSPFASMNDLYIYASGETVLSGGGPVLFSMNAGKLFYLESTDHFSYAINPVVGGGAGATAQIYCDPESRPAITSSFVQSPVTFVSGYPQVWPMSMPNRTTALPAATVDNRHQLYVVQGTSGASADVFSVCLQTASGTFNWKTIQTG